MKTALLTLLFISDFTLTGMAGVRVEDVPEKGLQPEVAVSADGTVHLVYLTGDPRASGVRYTCRKPGEPWKPSDAVGNLRT